MKRTILFALVTGTVLLLVLVAGTLWRTFGNAAVPTENQAETLRRVIVPTEQQAEALLSPVASCEQIREREKTGSDSFGYLLPWNLDTSRCETNAAMERDFGWQEGDAVRALEFLLERELAKPEGGDSNTVVRALDGLGRSGDWSVTNTLDRFLFAPVCPFRGELFKTRTIFNGLEYVAFARRLVSHIPAQERLMCYGAAAVWISAHSHPSYIRRGATALEACAIEEDNAANAEMLDRFLDEKSPECYIWHDRNARKRVAARFAGADGEPGAYFKAFLDAWGEPEPLDATCVDHLLHSLQNRGFGWGSTDSSMSAEDVFPHQRLKNIRLAQDYGLEEKDVPCTLERLYKKAVKVRDHEDDRGEARISKEFCKWVRITLANSHYRPAAAMLKKALRTNKDPEEDDIAAYIRIAGVDALPFIRDVLKKKKKGAFERNRNYDFYSQIAGLAQGDNVPKSTIKKVIAFLREHIREDRDRECDIEECLTSIDPDWKYSKAWKQMVMRHLAGLEKKTPDVSGCSRVADLVQSNNVPESFIREVIAFLKKHIQKDRDWSHWKDGEWGFRCTIDGCLNRIDPDWRYSKERKQIAVRRLAKTDNEYVKGHLTAVLKEFEAFEAEKEKQGKQDGRKE